MTPETFTQWLDTYPTWAEVRKVESELDAYRLRKETLENKWDRPASPYTGWGTEQQQYRLFNICETLASKGYKVTYNIKASTDERRVWDLISDNNQGKLIWYANTDWFSSSVGEITNR